MDVKVRGDVRAGEFYVVRPHNENVLGPGRLLSRERVGAAHTDSGTGSRWGHTMNAMRWYTKRGQTRAALCVQRTGCTGRRGDWVQVRAASLSAGQRSYSRCPTALEAVAQLSQAVVVAAWQRR